VDATVIQVIDQLGRGGAERLMRAYVPRLRSLGKDVRVIALNVRDGNTEAAALAEAGVPVEVAPVTKLRHLHEVAGLTRRLRDARPHIVHAHLDFATLLSAATRPIHGAAVIATMHLHETPPPFSRDGLRQRLKHAVMNRFMDSVIVLANAEAEWLREHGVTNTPIEVIPNGIETEKFRLRPAAERMMLRDRLGYAETDFVVLSVAVLRPQKGIDKLIAALAEIRARAPHTRLLVVGEGPEREKLEAQTKALDLSGLVRFAGFRDDIHDLMAAADLFVLPTLDDVQPTVVMEAMACGAPVVASAVGSVPDMITDEADGVLTTPGDVDALAQAISTLITDAPRRERLRKSGRETVEARFSLEKNVAATNALYDRIIAARR
jgi:glycosyltransferase involved in cell wall biosynthesis